jgi:RNA 3'-terminal phosphate cyclase
MYGKIKLIIIKAGYLFFKDRFNVLFRTTTKITNLIMIKIDGSILKGGGQILRSYIAYSILLTYIETFGIEDVRITKIKHKFVPKREGEFNVEILPVKKALRPTSLITKGSPCKNLRVTCLVCSTSFVGSVKTDLSNFNIELQTDTINVDWMV